MGHLCLNQPHYTPRSWCGKQQAEYVVMWNLTCGSHMSAPGLPMSTRCPLPSRRTMRRTSEPTCPPFVPALGWHHAPPSDGSEGAWSGATAHHCPSRTGFPCALPHLGFFSALRLRECWFNCRPTRHRWVSGRSMASRSRPWPDRQGLTPLSTYGV